jgi:hypothetical protein
MALSSVSGFRASWYPRHRYSDAVQRASGKASGYACWSRSGALSTPMTKPDAMSIRTLLSHFEVFALPRIRARLTLQSHGNFPKNNRFREYGRAMTSTEAKRYTGWYTSQRAGSRPCSPFGPHARWVVFLFRRL